MSTPTKEPHADESAAPTPEVVPDVFLIGLAAMDRMTYATPAPKFDTRPKPQLRLVPKDDEAST